MGQVMRIEFLETGSRLFGDSRTPFELNESEVLFFIRIRGRDSYFRDVYGEGLLSEFPNISKPKCISEYTRDADVHIDLDNPQRDYLTKKEWNNLNRIVSVDSLIQRCRGLRSIRRDKALSYIYRAYLFINNYFLEDRMTKLIVIGAIDNYVMHLLYLIGEDYGVTFLPITDSFMSPEYKLMIADGKPKVKRNTSDEEVDYIYENIELSTNAERNYYPLKQYLKCYYLLFSYIYRYAVRYIIGNRLLKKSSYEHAFMRYINTEFSVSSMFRIRFLNTKLRKTKKKSVYLPLHWYPEATTDYWIDSEFYVDYYSAMKGVVKELVSCNYDVVIKEHPHFLFMRYSGVYKDLISAGAILVSPIVSTKQVFDAVDLVLVMNGSTGIEAAVYGKPVAKLTNSYYGDRYIKTFDSSIEDIGHYTIAKSNTKKMIRLVAESSIKVQKMN